MTQDQKFREWLATAWPGQEFVYPPELEPLVSRAASAGMVARGWRPTGNVHFCVRIDHLPGETLRDN